MRRERERGSSPKWHSPQDRRALAAQAWPGSPGARRRMRTTPPGETAWTTIYGKGEERAIGFGKVGIRCGSVGARGGLGHVWSVRLPRGRGGPLRAPLSDRFWGDGDGPRGASRGPRRVREARRGEVHVAGAR